MDEEVTAESPRQQAIRPAYYGFGIDVWRLFGVIFTCIVSVIIYYLVKLFTSSFQNRNQQQEHTMNRINTRRHLLSSNRSLPAVGQNEGEPPSTPTEPGGTNPNIQCPVCLDNNVTHPVETNCGHRFCTQCILQYWRVDRFPRACRCPVCRREVTLIIPDRRNEGGAEYDELLRQVNDYNSRMSGEPRSLRSYIEDVPVLLRNLWNDLFSTSGLVFVQRVHVVSVVILLLLYIILPVDILPESFLGILGLIDDILVILGVTIYLTLVYREVVLTRYSASRHTARAEVHVRINNHE